MIEIRKKLLRIEVESDGTIFIKEENQIVENGVVISSVPHRSSVCPLDDVSNHEHKMVRDAASVHWTPEVIENYRQKVSSKAALTPGQS